MRAFAVAVTSASVLALAGPVLAQQGLEFPSCIASTMTAQVSRLIPPEVKAPAARQQLRGVIVRSLTWRPGQSIKVCFRSGTLAAQQRVVRIARDWLYHANVNFDFNEGDAPRKCKGDGHEDIKIDFVDGKGWWSFYGTVGRQRDPSMNLQYFGVDTPRYTNGQAAPEAELRRVILHEFGHALGMLHEHQSPGASCDAEIDWDAAYAMGVKMGWDQAQVNNNFRQLLLSDEFNTTDVDRRSIMHYSLPVQIFRAGNKSPCWVPDNMELSAQDRAFIARVYPRTDPGLVAGAPTPTTPATAPAATRGAKIGPKAAPAAPPTLDDLVKQYEDALKQSGMAVDKIAELSREFRTSMSGRDIAGGK